MLFHYSNFKVEIKNLKFTTEDGMIFPKTAIISLLDENDHVMAVELLGHLETDKIYERIENEEDINLDYCYVNNFSLSIYRDNRNLDKKTYVSLSSFSAQNAFFDSKFGVDFSFAHFRD